MRYLERTNIHKISKKYKYIIGWGTGPILKINYRPTYFNVDFLVDGTGKDVGKEYKGIEIKSVDELNKINEATLIIIYAIYENEILKQIQQYDKGQFDIIIYSLLDITIKNNFKIPEINGKSCEDLLLLSLVNQIGLDTVSFLEIGVCHPIMRNNTFLLYEFFSNMEGYNGVLVEANPLCWPLIEEYRPKDKLVKVGIDSSESGGLQTFYMFPHLLGHSTFSKNIAQTKIDKGYECHELRIPVQNINR